MKRKLRFSREFSKNVNTNYLIMDLAKSKLNQSHLLLLQTIAKFNSLKDEDAKELVNENIIKSCYKNGLINKAYFEEESSNVLYDIEADASPSAEIFYVLDFGGIVILDAFSDHSQNELIIPKMYMGTYNKYMLNLERYRFFRLMQSKNADFEFISQPPLIYLHNNALRFHAVMMANRLTENRQRLLLGILFFINDILPDEKEKASLITLLEQLFRGENVKKVCSTYGLQDKESNFFVLCICDTKETAFRVAASASLFSIKNAVNKIRFIILENDGIENFKNGQLIKYEDREFRKTNHKFF